MANDVIIRVRVKEDTRDGFAALGKHAAAQGEKAGDGFAQHFGVSIEKMTNRIQEPLKKAGTAIGERLGKNTGASFVTNFSQHVTSNQSKFTEIGQRIGGSVGDSISRSVSESTSRGIREGVDRSRGTIYRSGNVTSGSRSSSTTDHVRGARGGKGGDANVDVDVDKQSLLSRLADWGKQGAASFWESFSGGLSNFFSGDLITTLVKGAGILAIAPLIAAPVSAAVSAGILAALGTGAIAAGVVAAFKDPRIAAAGTELKDRLSKLFARFGEPFRGPVANFLEKLNQFVTTMIPNFDHLGKVLAPVADKLGSGIIGMLQNLLPGLIDGIENAAPVVEVLAKRLPDIGQALGDFFREIGENGDDAATFFNDLISVVIKLIDWLGKLIGFFTRLYGGIRDFVSGALKAIYNFGQTVLGWFARILDAGVAAFGWLPGIGAKLRTAKAQFADARKDINAELQKIKDRDVKIRIRTFGLAAGNAAVSIAEKLAGLGYASGGIVGQLPQIGQAATGGVRGGLTLVGERGPELADLSPGSRVYSNGDSMRMMAGAGGSDVLQVEFAGSSDPLVNALFERLQFKIGRRYFGSAQAGFGR